MVGDGSGGDDQNDGDDADSSDDDVSLPISCSYIISARKEKLHHHNTRIGLR